MGWPPTNRGRSTAATIGAFTDPTSVTTAFGWSTSAVTAAAGHGADRHGQHHQLGVGVGADCVDGAQLERPGGRVAVLVAARDVPARAIAARGRPSRR